jgi:CHASE2 domain-containing sensor protein
MKNIIKDTIIIFIFFKITISIVSFLYEHLPLQLIHFEHLLTEDIQFNDIYYSSKVHKNDKNKEVVVINSGSILKNENFRYELSNLIDIIGSYKPKKIGIDLIFEKHKENDSLLQKSIYANDVILGIDSKNNFKNVFESNKSGIINFPIKNNETVREYFNYSNYDSKNKLSFASVLSEVIDKDSIYYLKYNTDSKGFYNALDKKNEIEINNFPAIEAVDIINRIDTIEIKRLIENKIVIIGHLGTEYMDNFNDIEDKFKVPNNSSLYNRAQTMPGAIIHANAIQMMIDNDKILKIEGWLYEIITSIILYLFLVLFYYIHHKFDLSKSINILIILLSTIPIILLSCVYLMELNIYYKVGTLFMKLVFLEEFIDIADGFKKKFIRKK